MPPKKLILIVAIAVVAIAVGLVVTWDYVHQDPDGYYEYDYEYATSFTDKNGDTITPSTGRTFVIVDIVLKNANCDEGISTNLVSLVWTLTLDRMTYEVSVAYTSVHPDYVSMTLNKGKTWGYSVVFEVPDESVGKRDLSIGYYYNSLNNKVVLEYDPELRLRSA